MLGSLGFFTSYLAHTAFLWEKMLLLSYDFVSAIVTTMICSSLFCLIRCIEGRKILSGKTIAVEITIGQQQTIDSSL